MSKSTSQFRRRAGLGILFVLLAAAGIADPLSASAPFSWGWMFLVPAFAASTVLVIRQLMDAKREEFVMPILFGSFFGIRSLVESVWTNGQSWEKGASVAFVVAILSAGLGYAARMVTQAARD